MKFWLKRETDYIYLEQFIRAVGLCKDRFEVRDLVEKGRVRVNEENVFKPKMKLFEGDQVKIFDNHYKICGEKMLEKVKIQKSENAPKVYHGYVKNWIKKK